MPMDNEATWEALAAKLDALFAHKVSLGPLTSGDGVILEVENTTGDRSQILFSTEHLPQIAVSLLRAHQIAAGNLPGDHLLKMLERSQDAQIKHPVAARSVKAVADEDNEKVSLLIHCGTTFLHFTLPYEAALELRYDLNKGLKE